MLSVFLQGIATGFILQLAIGPVFFFILNLSFQRTTLDGILAVLAVTLADYLYIALAIMGVGKLLVNKRIKIKTGIISSIILIIFALLMIFKESSVNSPGNTQISSGYLSSFLSAFLLTASSPLTILFWTSLFANKALEYNYTDRQLIYFGLSAGLPTLLFLGMSVIILSQFKTSISTELVRLLNILVGIIFIIYAVYRFISLCRHNK